MNSTINLSVKRNPGKSLSEIVFEESGVDVSKCYQCGKCSAGCSVHNCNGMDVSPNRVLRMVQLGLEDVLKTKTIWSCVLCSTCTTRCPRNIDVPKVMDALRITAKKRGITQNAKVANVFHDAFMKSIKKYGRVYELGLVLERNLMTGKLFMDAELGLPMITKGKIAFLPKKVGSDQIQKIIENVKRMEDK